MGTVQLWPALLEVEAHFHYGYDFVASLPGAYDHYHITFAKSVTIENLKEMYRWANAKTIVVRDTNSLISSSLMNLEIDFDMRNWKNLLELDFNADRASELFVRLSTYFNNIPSLKTIKVDVSSMNVKESQDFIRVQRMTPSIITHSVVTFSRP